MKMKMTKAIILPFFLLAGIASGSQQPQGIVSNTYDGEDDAGSSQQRRTAPYEEEAVFGGAGAANLEDEYAVHSTTTDVYDDNADEEVVDGRNRRQLIHEGDTTTDFYDYDDSNTDEEFVFVDESRRQLRGNNNNRRLNKSRPECRRGDPFNNCPNKGEYCWKRVIGSSWSGNGVCVRSGACWPSGVYRNQIHIVPPLSLSDWGERRCCSGKARTQKKGKLGGWYHVCV